MNAPTFWQVAFRAQWIGAFFLSLLIAAGLGALAQWQLERSFVPPQASTVQLKGEAKSLMLDQTRVYIVENRVQNSQSGYWLIANSTDEAGTNFSVALAWTSSLEAAETARTELRESVRAQAFLPTTLFKLDPEAPMIGSDSSKPYLLGSMSMAQLINLHSPDQPFKADPNAWVAGSAEGGLLFAGAGTQPIELAYVDPAAINWLTVFYAIEWTVFAGFAVFLWWRLVRDTQIRERAANKSAASATVN